MTKHSFSDLNEFYNEVKSLSAALQGAGFIDEGKKVYQYTFETAWTTGSELLGELRIIFGDLAKKVSGDLGERIRSCEHFAANHRKILGLD
jgi:hypothetical protein